MVARFRARAARRAEEARLAAEAMEEELAQQSEKSGTRQEEEATLQCGSDATTTQAMPPHVQQGPCPLPLAELAWALGPEASTLFRCAL